MCIIITSERFFSDLVCYLWQIATLNGVSHTHTPDLERIVRNAFIKGLPPLYASIHALTANHTLEDVAATMDDLYYYTKMSPQYNFA